MLWQYLEYNRDDLSKNDVYRVMRHYNVQPFLHNAAHTSATDSTPGPEAKEEEEGLEALKQRRRRWW